MSFWEKPGASNEWHTPAYVFDALGEVFDLDVAAPIDGGLHVPAHRWLHTDSLLREWAGFVWCNPPFGGRNGLVPWLDKFFGHHDGIALTPDRTSAPWWQCAAARSDAILFVDGKIRFLRPDGTAGISPSNGTTLFAAGGRAVAALGRASRRGLGLMTVPMPLRNAPPIEPSMGDLTPEVVQ